MGEAGPTTSSGRVDHLVTLNDLATWSGDPLYLSVGIDTAGSSIPRAFGPWASAELRAPASAVVQKG